MLYVLQRRRRLFLQSLMTVALEVDQEVVMMVGAAAAGVEVAVVVSYFGDYSCF